MRKKAFSEIKYVSGDPLPISKLRLESQQIFISRLMSPANDQQVVFVMHKPGSGKTAASLEAAMSYLKLFRLFSLDEGYRVIIIGLDRKSTRLNSSHITISYAVFC